jgi:hypothetical protein
VDDHASGRAHENGNDANKRRRTMKNMLLATVVAGLSITSANAATYYEKGVASMLIYAQKCDVRHIQPFALQIAQMSADNNSAAIKEATDEAMAEMRSIPMDEKTKWSMWCTMMRPSVDRVNAATPRIGG